MGLFKGNLLYFHHLLHKISATTVSIYHNSHETDCRSNTTNINLALIVFLTQMMHVFNPKDPFNVLFMNFGYGTGV